MIRYSWHINITFLKSANRVQINSIVSEYNHNMNLLITKIALKFQKLTNKMLENIKFWIIQERMGIIIQYNLLVISFSDKVINKKNLSNII